MSAAFDPSAAPTESPAVSPTVSPASAPAGAVGSTGSTSSAESVLLHAATELQARLPDLAQALTGRGWRLATAESCTGGLIAALCTSVAGSSDWFDAGFVTYSNAAKTHQLGVPEELLAAHGAVSEEVARAMAAGALAHSLAHVAVAVTGIAGPGGAVPGKPVGTVWLAWAWRASLNSAADRWQVGAECLHLPGDRTAVRSSTVARALERALELARGPA